MPPSEKHTPEKKAKVTNQNAKKIESQFLQLYLHNLTNPIKRCMHGYNRTPLAPYLASTRTSCATLSP